MSEVKSVSEDAAQNSQGVATESRETATVAEALNCELFDKRGFHDWRWLGCPLSNPSCYERWCTACGLRQVPGFASNKAQWVNDSV